MKSRQKCRLQPLSNKKEIIFLFCWEYNLFLFFLLVANIIFFYLYFLLLSEMSREMKAKEMPTMQTPSQSAWVHTYPAQNVPSEPPMK